MFDQFRAYAVDVIYFITITYNCVHNCLAFEKFRVLNWILHVTEIYNPRLRSKTASIFFFSLNVISNYFQKLNTTVDD